MTKDTGTRPRRTGVPGFVAAFVVVTVLASGCSREQPDATAEEQDIFPEGMLVSPVTERFVRCMHDAGWMVEPSWSGGTELGAAISADQLSAYEAAADECAESSGWNEANTLSTWTREQIEELYAQEVETHECLIRIGFASDEPPSLQHYVDTLGTADQYYAMLPGLDNASPTDIIHMARECPPPTWFLTIEGL